jgi:hypothetical protein
MEERIKALEEQVASLTRQVGILEDVNAIRRLQYAYGYFIDKCMYDETVDLFAEDGEVWFMGRKFKGRAGVHRLYCGSFKERFTGGRNGPVPGFLLDHPQLQAIIDVAPDGRTAKVRARSMMQAGRHRDFASRPVGDISERATHGTRQWWEGGIYENQYVKEDGVWKIKVLNYRPFWHCDFDTGWAQTHYPYIPENLLTTLYPDDPTGPDELEEPLPELWPNTDVVPFHYAHPVTGEPIEIPDPIPLDSGWKIDDLLSPADE